MKASVEMECASKRGAFFCQVISRVMNVLIHVHAVKRRSMLHSFANDCWYRLRPTVNSHRPVEACRESCIEGVHPAPPKPEANQQRAASAASHQLRADAIRLPCL